MPYDEKISFSVRKLQILDESGKCDDKAKPDIDNSDIKKMYELMVTTRIFDDNALKLQREGRIGTYASVRGQEAAQVGSAYAMRKDDMMFPSFREAASSIVIGMPMHMIYNYWSGDERGGHPPEGVNCFPVSVPVGSHPLHATGFAIASKIKKEKNAAVAYFGDGATSEGDTLEAMNFAGVFKAPVVFICQNNQWAISVPRKNQTAAETIAQKAIAFGIEGIQVDGNDIFAVYKATREALERASAGNGPTLIECFTYRMGDHTTADDAKRYRNQKEVDDWKEKDPIDRLRKYMVKNKLWTDIDEKKLQNNAKNMVDAAIEAFEKIPGPEKNDMFNYVFEKPTKQMEEQMK